MADAPASSASATPLSQNTPAAQPGKREFSPEKTPAQAPPPENPYKGTKHKVKIAKQEQEVDYDELVRGYQRAQDSQRRYQEAQRLAMEAKKSQDDIQSHLAKGDVSWLVNKMGPDKAREAFENYLIGQLEYDALPDSEKKARTLERENQRLKQEFDQAKQAQQQEAYQYTVQQAHAELDTEISDALSDLGGAKPTPRLVIRILDEIEARMASKGNRITAKEARQKAVQGILQDVAEYLPHLPPDELLKALPKEVLDKISKYQVEQVLGEKQAKRFQPREKTASKPQKGPETVKDWYANMDKKYSKKRG